MITVHQNRVRFATLVGSSITRAISAERTEKRCNSAKIKHSLSHNKSINVKVKLEAAFFSLFILTELFRIADQDIAFTGKTVHNKHQLTNLFKICTFCIKITTLKYSFKNGSERKLEDITFSRPNDHQKLNGSDRLSLRKNP